MRNQHVTSLTIVIALVLILDVKEVPGTLSNILVVENSRHQANKPRPSSDPRQPNAIKLERAPIMGFPASRADEGPDNQGPPPMPDVEEH